jgi:hypothetical protein
MRFGAQGGNLPNRFSDRAVHRPAAAHAIHDRFTLVGSKWEATMFLCIGF